MKREELISNKGYWLAKLQMELYDQMRNYLSSSGLSQTELANKLGYDYLVNGENLGQVASQTLSNMYVIHHGLKITVHQPLLAIDKNETVKLAKEIGTYELSIEDNSPCPYLPKEPKTKSKVERIEREEEKVEMDNLIREAVDGVQTYVIK